MLNKIMIILFCLFIQSCCLFQSNKNEIRIERDTTYITKYDTIKITFTPDIKITRTDTVIKFYPFVASKDTIIKYIVNNRIKYDTVKFEYSYPENLLKLNLKRSQDSIIKIMQTETQKHIIEDNIFGFSTKNLLILCLVLLFILLYLFKK